MRKALRFTWRVAVLLAVALPAFAQCPADMREFLGSITKITDSRVVVESRLGDGVAFDRGSETDVRGRAGGWAALRVGDGVSVCWRFDDRPRKAYAITLRE